MFKLLLLLFVIKLYARNNILKRIKKKHGQDILSHVRLLDNFKTKSMKNEQVSNLLNYASKKILENLNVKLSLKDNNNAS